MNTVKIVCTSMLVSLNAMSGRMLNADSISFHCHCTQSWSKCHEKLPQDTVHARRVVLHGTHFDIDLALQCCYHTSGKCVATKSATVFCMLAFSIQLGLVMQALTHTTQYYCYLPSVCNIKGGLYRAQIMPQSLCSPNLFLLCWRKFQGTSRDPWIHTCTVPLTLHSSLGSRAPSRGRFVFAIHWYHLIFHQKNFGPSGTVRA